MIGQGLTLVTGATGSGKTAFVVSELMAIKDRPLCVMGIPDLLIDHDVCPPVEQWVEQRPDPDDPSLLLPYFRFAPGSLVVLDEAQRVFRPRGSGSKVPDVVAAFETRRHTGVDFVLITQHPNLLDANVRRLVNRHIHIHTTFVGRYELEWVGLGDPEEKASRDLAARRRYSPPKKVFGLYKSSELHTKVVRRLPWQLFVLVVLLPALAVAGWYVYGRVITRMGGDVVEEAHVVERGFEKAVVREVGGRSAVRTAQDYVRDYTPRVVGLAHTAPVYDGLTRAVDVPTPSGCIKSKTRCKCYDQRGNEYPTTPEICEQIIHRYLFVDYVNPDQGRKDGGVSHGDRPAVRQDSRAGGDVSRGAVGSLASAGGSIAGVPLSGAVP